VQMASRAQLLVRTDRAAGSTPKPVASQLQSLNSLKALCENDIDGNGIAGESGAPLAPAAGP
jgi:hypothetical protein